MTTTMRNAGTPQMSDYDGRIVEISVTGVCNQNIKRVSSYTMKVPHNRMNKAMREIYSLGGKITGVTVLEKKSAATVREVPQATKAPAPAKRATKSTTTKRSIRRKKED